MKATFDVAGDGDGSVPAQSFEVAVCFNGIPGAVVLEVSRLELVGGGGEGNTPATTVNKRQTCLMRSVLKSSEARAIASAILSAATEAKS